MALPRSFNASLLAVCALVVGSAVIATVFVERLRVNHRAYVAQALYTAPAASAPQWTFTTPSAGVSLATLVSTNSLVQPSPFKGGLATLGVAHGPDGDTIRLDIDGEMTCSYAPTASSVDISFDGGPTQSFACAPAPAGARKMLFDGDHSTAYLADPITFLDRLKAAHHITINAAFAAQSDPQAIEFDLPQADPVAAAPAGVGGQSPALAMAAVSSLPAAAGAATVPLGTQATVTPAVKSDDAAGEGDHHGHGHRGHHHHHR